MTCPLCNRPECAGRGRMIDCYQAGVANPAQVTSKVMLRVGGLGTGPAKVEALDRAALWAWYAALNAPDTARRMYWREVEHRFEGASSAVRWGL